MLAAKKGSNSSQVKEGEEEELVQLLTREAAVNLREKELDDMEAGAKKEANVQQRGRVRLDKWEEQLAADEKQLQQDKRKLLKRSREVQLQEDEANTLVEAWRNQLESVEEFADETADPADNLANVSEAIVDLRQQVKLSEIKQDRLEHDTKKALQGRQRSDAKKEELRGEVRALEKNNAKLERQNEELRRYKKNSKQREERLNNKVSRTNEKWAGVAEGLADKHAAALRKLGEEEKVRESKNTAPATKSGGRFTNQLRMLIYQILAQSVAMHSLPHVLKLVFEYCGVGDLQVPADTTVRRIALEMKLLADLHVGFEVSQSSSVLAAWDGSMRDKQPLVSLTFTTPSKTLYAGVSLANGKLAQDVVGALLLKEGQIKRITESVFGAEVAAGFGFEQCAVGRGGQGVMNDHAATEEAAADALEKIIHERLLADPAYASLPESEQQQACKIVRQKCFQHKIENLSMACMTGSKVYRRNIIGTGEGDGGRGEEQPVCASRLVYELYKLLGPSKSPSDLNICNEYL